MSREKSIAVLGPGLLGASLLLEARRMGIADIRAYTRREKIAAEILRRGWATTASTDLAEAVAGASFIVLASPVGTYMDLAERLCALPLAPDVLVTDVGSVKSCVLRGAGECFRRHGVSFIGSHPMAGSEAKGLDAARPGLFQKAACIITPTEDDAPEQLQRLESFWQNCGCTVTRMTAARHDEIVARISHLPHLAAVAVALATLQRDVSLADFAAGGLRDTTRVASSSPEMWREILMENRQNVLAEARELRRILDELLEMLEKVEQQPLLATLEEAKRLREIRYPSS